MLYKHLPEGWTSEKVKVNGINIHYLRTGGDKPVMIMAHGITDNGFCWKTLADKLEDHYDIIMYDARGHGLSDAPKQGYTINDHVEDLKGLIDVLEINNPVMLGHSMGGAIVSAFSAKYQEIPKQVILEDPVHFHKKDKEDLNELKKMAYNTRKNILQWNKMELEGLVKMAREKNHPGWRQEDYIPWAVAKKQASPHLVETFKQLGYLGDVFPKIKAPVLILKAETDSGDMAYNRKLTSLIPKGKIIHIDGAGHNIRRDQPEKAVEYINQFLKE